MSEIYDYDKDGNRMPQYEGEVSAALLNCLPCEACGAPATVMDIENVGLCDKHKEPVT